MVRHGNTRRKSPAIAHRRGIAAGAALPGAQFAERQACRIPPPGGAVRVTTSPSPVDPMQRPRSLTIAALCLSAGLGACASDRLAGPRTRAPGPRADFEAPVAAIPSGTVTAAPLAPPPGASASPEVAPPPGPVAAANPAAPTVIAEPVTPPPAPPPVVTTGRAGVVGGWDARDATGATCRVTLSSAPSLDLYKANSAGCQNKELSRVSAWDYRDGEVYLYQPGGTVAARLRQGGAGLDGALTKSGASLALNR